MEKNKQVAVSPVVWKQIKLFAANNNLSIRQVVEKALEKYFRGD
jgi:hypothetical protein